MDYFGDKILKETILDSGKIKLNHFTLSPVFKG